MTGQLLIRQKILLGLMEDGLLRVQQAQNVIVKETVIPRMPVAIVITLTMELIVRKLIADGVIMVGHVIPVQDHALVSQATMAQIVNTFTVQKGRVQQTATIRATATNLVGAVYALKGITVKIV